jgi:hypothetical protein
MSEYLRSMTPGIANAEATPPDSAALYASVEELEALYGTCTTEADIRAAMVIAHAFWGRSSLWPTQDTRELRLPSGRNETRLPLTPVLQILEASAMYAPGRRWGQNSLQGTTDYSMYLMLTGGGYSRWTALDVRQMSVDGATGMVYLPTLLLLPMSVVRITYVAGLLDIPPRVKLGLVEIINTLHNKGQSDRTAYAVGRVGRKYASDSWVTPAAQQLLAPWVVTTLM